MVVIGATFLLAAVIFLVDYVFSVLAKAMNLI